MALFVQAIFVIAALIAIISFFAPKDKKKNEGIKIRPVGLYKANVEVKGQTGSTPLEVQTEVELVREYGEGEVHIEHKEIFNVPKELVSDVKEILESEHTLVAKEDVKWNL